MDRRFIQTQFAVNIHSDYSRSIFWDLYHTHLDYQSENSGLVCSYGPQLFYEANWAMLNGIRVLFYYGSGELVDESKMTAAVQERCPRAIFRTVPQLIAWFGIESEPESAPAWPSVYPPEIKKKETWSTESAIHGCVECTAPEEVAYILTKHYPIHWIEERFLWDDKHGTQWEFFVVTIKNRSILFYLSKDPVIDWTNIRPFLETCTSAKHYADAMNAHNAIEYD